MRLCFSTYIQPHTSTCIFRALRKFESYVILSCRNSKKNWAQLLLLSTTPKDTCPACTTAVEFCELCDFMTGHASLDKIYEPCVKIRERLLHLHALTPFVSQCSPWCARGVRHIYFSYRSMATRTYSCHISHLAQASSGSRTVVHFPSSSLIRRRRVLPDKSQTSWNNWVVATISSGR